MRLIQGAAFVIGYYYSTIAIACYQSTILEPAPFLGNDSEIVRLSDGSIWEISGAYNYFYEYYPPIIVCPEKNIIIFKNQKILVERLK